MKIEAPNGTIATLDSPDEGLAGLKLEPFVLDQKGLSFELKATAAKFEGKLNAAATEAVGTWTQRGHSLPLTLKRTKTPTPVPKIVGPEQVWEGKLSVGAGLSLRIVFHIGKSANGKLMATMDSPDQEAKGLKVDSVTLDKKGAGAGAQPHQGQVRGQAQCRGYRGEGNVDAVGLQPSPGLEED